MMGIGQFDSKSVALATNLSIANLIEKALFQPVSKQNLETMLNMYDIEGSLNATVKKIYDAWTASGKKLQVSSGLFKKKEVTVEFVPMPKLTGTLRNVFIDTIYSTYTVPEFEQVEKKYLVKDLLSLEVCPYIKFKTDDDEYALVIKAPCELNSDNDSEEVSSYNNNLAKCAIVASANIEKMAAHNSGLTSWDIGDKCLIADNKELDAIKSGSMFNIDVHTDAAGTLVFQKLYTFEFTGKQGTGKTTLMRGMFGSSMSDITMHLHDGTAKTFFTRYLGKDVSIAKRMAWSSVLEEWARTVKAEQLKVDNNFML